MKQGKQVWLVTDDSGNEFDEYRLDAHIEKIRSRIETCTRMTGYCKVMVLDDETNIVHEITVRDGGEEVTP